VDKQVARNLTDGVDGFLRGMRYVIHDRDPLFIREFRDLLRCAGVKSIRLPAHSPDLNAYAERSGLSDDGPPKIDRETDREFVEASWDIVFRNC
jgi:hypothetical protein